MKDKYGYDIPNKTPFLIEQGSNEAMEYFKTKLTELANIAKDAYPQETMTKNRFNVLFSAASELMSSMITESVERHEKGELPKYGFVITTSISVRKRLAMLLETLELQELMMMKYLNNCPELMREENDYIVSETVKLGHADIAQQMNKRFRDNWEIAYRDDITKQDNQK